MPVMLRFSSACSRSYSKSLIDLTPLTINAALSRLARSTARSVKPTIFTRLSPSYRLLTASIRSSADNMLRFSGFMPTPITMRPNSFSVRSTMSAWPMVNGSNEPTNSAVRVLFSSFIAVLAYFRVE